MSQPANVLPLPINEKSFELYFRKQDDFLHNSRCQPKTAKRLHGKLLNICFHFVVYSENEIQL